MSEIELGTPVRTPQYQWEGPVEVRSAKGQLLWSYGDHYLQTMGVPAAFNALGVPYATVLFSYAAVLQEEIEDAGYDTLKKAMGDWLDKITYDEDFYSIEWRIAPTIELGELVEDALIQDKITGALRPGREVKAQAALRMRLVVHKQPISREHNVPDAQPERYRPMTLVA